MAGKVPEIIVLNAQAVDICVFAFTAQYILSGALPVGCLICRLSFMKVIGHSEL